MIKSNWDGFKKIFFKAVYKTLDDIFNQFKPKLCCNSFYLISKYYATRFDQSDFLNKKKDRKKETERQRDREKERRK